MEKNLKENLEFVEREEAELLRLYLGKFLLIYDQEVVGSFDGYEKAASDGIEQFGPEGSFLVYHVTKDKPINLVMEARF